MEKQQEGIVVEVSDGMAKVKASRHSDCENCGSCPGNTAIIVDALNPVGAERGQRVAIEVKEVNMLKAAFIVYMLPLITATGGAFAGNYLAGLYQAAGSLWYTIASGLAAFGLSIIYIKYFDRNARTNDKMKPVITRILS
ncbi:SoxR reducing system RseC family protein [Sporomusa sp.]|uniref:SoxR reducing system RseC family protein n=1 Tax=Sporomusa sp. TaxID=2078658 RepID=UPI002CAA4B67|nr:SoxR reducing system RseC family protein [Sporomusa sp.]HWR44650.1 SoxR reducing system RseC family protein [Sporomusa sp.]